MNKILFKLIEGKGKFFLMRGIPDEFKASVYYTQLLNTCISEDLKNGEIVNPEALNIDYEEMQESGHSLKDGDTFDLLDGMGFEELNYPNKSWIRLLPEKPEQKEESVIRSPGKAYEVGYAKGKLSFCFKG